MPCQRYRGAPPYGRDVSPAPVIARQNHAHDLPVFLRYRDCAAKSRRSRLRSRPSCSAPYLYRYAIAPKRWYSRLKSFAECAYFISQAVHRQSVDHPSLYTYTSCPAWISGILLCVIVVYDDEIPVIPFLSPFKTLLYFIGNPSAITFSAYCGFSLNVIKKL